MSRIGKAFTTHPASVGETYFEHLRSALGFSLTMCRAALCCAIHAVLPFLFQRSGSSTIDELHRRMIRQRSRLGASTPAAARETHGSETARQRTAAA